MTPSGRKDTTNRSSDMIMVEGTGWYAWELVWREQLEGIAPIGMNPLMADRKWVSCLSGIEIPEKQELLLEAVIGALPDLGGVLLKLAWMLLDFEGMTWDHVCVHQTVMQLVSIGGSSWLLNWFNHLLLLPTCFIIAWHYWVFLKALWLSLWSLASGCGRMWQQGHIGECANGVVALSPMQGGVGEVFDWGGPTFLFLHRVPQGVETALCGKVTIFHPPAGGHTQKQQKDSMGEATEGHPDSQRYNT